MSITMPAQQDAEGNWPEGAWLNVEPVYEGGYSTSYGYDHKLKRDTYKFSDFDPALGRFVEVQPMFGPYRRDRIVGYRPSAFADRVMAQTYKGCVLSLGEVNGYHDSDFYAIVWDEADQATRRIEYASTRGWTYDCGASIDATDEVKAAYAAYEEAQYRRRVEERERATQAKREEVAKALAVDIAAIARLESAYGRIDPRPIATSGRYNNHYSSLSKSFGFTRESNTLDSIIALAISGKSGRLRNAFRKKMAEQVLAWMVDPTPQYPTPLSRKQLQYI
ncbi:hypothetical protein CcrC1_gp312 [Caulobacter phage C1]|nr:hypothetical protein CcrC1_gp312 [Caulobacter phage C1]UTU08541.1 hypothetical protein CcrC2_gp313 [Caulobacter phage C2]UTU09057.1 hypothetical protein CcrJ4_gp308 [Caulobacter phage J4]UTU10174.1 hypothetical protein CcrRB23_gp312 [Caulobacter phage RB23]WGN97208.1 hypothetical protein [Bertelyvirus sp.]